MSVVQLYGGSVELGFDRHKHTYTVDGEAVPNVTTITGVIAKHGLDGWKFRQSMDHLAEHLRPGLNEVAIRRLLDDAAVAADKVTKEAGYIGSSIHRWIEGHIELAPGSRDTPGDLPLHPAVRAAVEAFLEWERETEPEYIDSERKVFSKTHRYVGTLDTIARIDSKRQVVDYKSSNRIYQEHFAQLGAYSLAAEEEDGEAIEGGIILHLPKVAGKKAKAHQSASIEADKEFFLGVRAIYRRIYNR